MALAILYTFAQNSTTITNSGSGGTSGNGTANFSGWHATNGNGAPYPYYGTFSAAGDAIAIPNTSYNTSGTGAFVHSWEIGFWLAGAGNNAVQRIYDKAWGGFSIQIQSGYLMFIRATATSGSYVYWQATTTPLTAGHTYYIEVAVNLPANPQSCAAGNVSMRIGTDLGAPVQQAQNAPVKYNAATSWYNDSGAAALGNCSAGCTGYNCNFAVMVYREFNGEAKNWATYSDWSADVVRWNPAVATTISCNPSTTTPNIGQNYTVTGTLQTTGGVKLAGKSIDVWYSTDNEGTWHVATAYCTTDSNGNYSYTQNGIASPGEYEYVAFEGDAGHNASNSSGSIWQAVGQKIPTTIYETPSTTTPTIGTQFTLSGGLSAMGIGLASTGVRLWTGTSQSGPWTPSGGVIAATTDSSGNYSISITAVAGVTWYGTSYDGDATHLAASCSPNAVEITGMANQDTSSLTCIASTTTPNVGDIITLSGVLKDTTTSAGISATVTLSTGPTTTSDSNGNYSFSVTALAGTHTYNTTYAGTTTHAACSSPTVTIVAIIVVTTTVVPAMVTDVPTPTFLQYIYANPPVVPAMIATAGLNPTLTIGYTITTTVVGMEIATVIVYPDVEHIWEFCFPAVATGSELRARPLIVSQLSTQVNTTVVGDCIIETQNYTGIEESETVTTNVVPAMEAKVCDAYGVIAYHKVLEFNVVVIDEIEIGKYLIETVDLEGIVTDSIDVIGEVATE